MEVDALPPSDDETVYLSGFGNHFSSEALKGALPIGQNSPQVCPYGLYAEQFSGTAFTAPRSKNFRSWFYRSVPFHTLLVLFFLDWFVLFWSIRPSVCHSKFVTVEPGIPSNDETIETFVKNPNQFRWNPMNMLPEEGCIDFIQGLVPICGAGEPTVKEGLCIYNYVANRSMQNKVLYNSDGDFLIVPQVGTLQVRTEFGLLVVEVKQYGTHG